MLEWDHTLLERASHTNDHINAPFEPGIALLTVVQGGICQTIRIPLNDALKFISCESIVDLGNIIRTSTTSLATPMVNGASIHSGQINHPMQEKQVLYETGVCCVPSYQLESCYMASNPMGDNDNDDHRVNTVTMNNGIYDQTINTSTELIRPIGSRIPVYL